MPQKFHYGDGMGTNPIMMMQALSAQVLRFKRVMSDHCVIICSSLCNGFFNDKKWPYLRECYEWFQRPDEHPAGYEPPGRIFYRDEWDWNMCANTVSANAFHPFHGKYKAKKLFHDELAGVAVSEEHV